MVAHLVAVEGWNRWVGGCLAYESPTAALCACTCGYGCVRLHMRLWRRCRYAWLPILFTGSWQPQALMRALSRAPQAEISSMRLRLFRDLERFVMRTTSRPLRVDCYAEPMCSCAMLAICTAGPAKCSGTPALRLRIDGMNGFACVAWASLQVDCSWDVRGLHVCAAHTKHQGCTRLLAASI